MKKIYSILLILAAAAGFTNCTKTDLVVNKETGNGGTVVYATTDASTKTKMLDDYKVLWSTDDKIKFVKNGGITTYTYTLLSGEGTTNGTFTCAEAPVDGTYTVYYPASYDGTNWPAQTYVNATDISGALMKATNVTVSGGVVPNISFNNEGGILRYTVKGNKIIRAINIKSTSPALDVTLNCVPSGVGLTTEGKVFNIAVKPGEYSNATLTFTATDESKATKTASSFTVTKNKVSTATFESDNLSFVPLGFVDLGLTVKWATCNLGASNPEDPGDYYMWGATALMYSAVDYSKTNNAFTIVTENPYGSNYKNTWDASKGFDFNNVPFADGVFKDNEGERNVFTKYTTIDKYAKTGTPDNIKTLNPEDDAATAKNASWRMPTIDDFKSLVANCVLVWTPDYNSTGNAGYIVYKAKDTDDKGKANMNGTWKKWNGSGYTDDSAATGTYSFSDTHIFLPAAGFGNNTTLGNKNVAGCYCSRDLNNTKNNSVGAVNFTKSMFNIAYSYSRSYGFSIRPVTEE